MAKIIAVSNEKGGIGKTTTACAVALALNKKENNVLIIDLDPQGNLSFCLGADNILSPTSNEVLRGKVNASHAIQHTRYVDVISSNILLNTIETEYSGSGRESLLKNALEQIEMLYDYIIIDTPPSLGLLTINSYVAAQYVLIPMACEVFSLNSAKQIYESVEKVKEKLNPELEFAGIVLTKYSPHSPSNAEMMEKIKNTADSLGIKLLKTHIRNSVAVSEAQSLKQSLFDYAPKNKASLDYIHLADELNENGI